MSEIETGLSRCKVDALPLSYGPSQTNRRAVVAKITEELRKDPETLALLTKNISY